MLMEFNKRGEISTENKNEMTGLIVPAQETIIAVTGQDIGREIFINGILVPGRYFLQNTSVLVKQNNKYFRINVSAALSNGNIGDQWPEVGDKIRILSYINNNGRVFINKWETVIIKKSENLIPAKETFLKVMAKEGNILYMEEKPCIVKDTNTNIVFKINIRSIKSDAANVSAIKILSYGKIGQRIEVYDWEPISLIELLEKQLENDKEASNKSKRNKNIKHINEHINNDLTEEEIKNMSDEDIQKLLTSTAVHKQTTVAVTKMAIYTEEELSNMNDDINNDNLDNDFNDDIDSYDDYYVESGEYRKHSDEEDGDNLVQNRNHYSKNQKKRKKQILDNKCTQNKKMQEALNPSKTMEEILAEEEATQKAAAAAKKVAEEEEQKNS